MPAICTWVDIAVWDSAVQTDTQTPAAGMPTVIQATIPESLTQVI